MNPIYNATIGTAPSDFATLRVRGDQLPVNSSLFGGLCTFRSDVASVTEQGWEMWRDLNHIGRIWHYGGNGPSPGGHRAFHIQSTEPGDQGQDRFSGVFVINNDFDGLWMIHNGPPIGGRTFPDPALQLLDRSGYAALGSRNNYMNTGTRPRGPWSRWHLFHDVVGTKPFFAFRSQMQNGMTMTGNSDHAYIGQWYDQGTNGTGAEVDDHSNLVIASSDDALTAGLGHHWDHISFRFMGDMAASQGAASGVEGLEMMRIRPFRATTNDPIEGFVGIGDFLAASTGPEERLDLLDRTIRLRAFSGGATYQTSTADRVMVADAADGRVYWRPMTDFAGQTDCDWKQLTGNNVVTAYSGAPSGCPNETNSVGIGVAPVATNKVQVLGANATNSYKVGILSNLQAGTLEGTVVDAKLTNGTGVSSGTTRVAVSAESRDGVTTYGIRSKAEMYTQPSGFVRNYGLSATGTIKATGAAAQNYGGYLESTVVTGATCNQAYGLYTKVEGGGNTNHGIWSQAVVSTNSPSQNYGVLGQALNATYNFGVYGYCSGTGNNDWALYGGGRTLLNGPAFLPGGVAITSDATLKTNVQPIENASNVIAQLSPVTYDFLTADHPGIALPQGNQAGVLAQELEMVLPDLVTEVTFPPTFDSLGVEITPEETVKAVRYTGLIPYLIAAVKEQQQRMDMMQQDLAACCTPSDADLDPRSSLTDPITPLGKNSNRLTIAPNPFQEQTTLSYLLEAPARVQLQVNTENGLHLVTLRDQQQAEGAYSMTWNTQDLAPGVYYVTLFADGVPVVKKAVKVR